MYPRDITFQTTCDREWCHRTSHHVHRYDEPDNRDLTEPTTYRRLRGPSFSLEDHGGMYGDLCTVRDLIIRLGQLDMDAHVAFEVQELLVFDEKNVITVLSPYAPETEDFNANDNLLTAPVI